VGRRLGQHFLVRGSVLARIAAAVAPEPAELILEIGPGKGALTGHLLGRAQRVVAIEIDPVLVQYLRAKYRDEPRLEIIEADILKSDIGQWGRLAVAGNLPYYITSPIVEKILCARALLSRAALLVQKEVALRLTTGPGTRDYGYLSVATQFFAEVELLFTVPASAFQPPPQVDSAAVRITPRTTLPDVDADRFLRFVSQCFKHKRKTLRNNLLTAFERERLDALPELAQRAEQLSTPEFIELYRKLYP
jgi:16S rRNA (adenine1518-N6/adenine1519-N6)-dimethyltransferase